MRPRIRSLQVAAKDGPERIVLTDPTRLAEGMLVVTQDEVRVLMLLDGTRTVAEVQRDCRRLVNLDIPLEVLASLVDELAAHGFLAGVAFDDYYRRLEREFRSKGRRSLENADGYGVPAEQLAEYLDGIIETYPGPASRVPVGRLIGLVAPHLDFPRGAPCYGPAYRLLRDLSPEERPRRVVVLGTNHFGRSRGVVATRVDFETPWGVVPTDSEFLHTLQERCGGDLFLRELDHLREHSVELHAIWIHRVLGDSVRIVPILCPDPTGPEGTAVSDPGGVSLENFIRNLQLVLREDPEPTLLLGSVDLSHVGGYFGDPGEFSDLDLGALDLHDREALAWAEAGDAEGYRRHMARTGNPTRHCSVGNLYCLLAAGDRAFQVRPLGYHQAVTPELSNCVTCAALAVYASPNPAAA